MVKDIVIREHKPGDPSLVCYYYYKLFEKQYAFNGSVEKYFMSGILELFDEREGSRLWIVEKDGQIAGSIAIIKRGEGEAQLRWFGVDMALQGQGLGNTLMRKAMDFCKDKGYKHVILWSMDILKPALHLYEKFGFVLTETKPNYEWASYAITEEKWEYNEIIREPSQGGIEHMMNRPHVMVIKKEKSKTKTGI